MKHNLAEMIRKNREEKKAKELNYYFEAEGDLYDFQ
jgi:hypothetical protein